MCIGQIGLREGPQEISRTFPRLKLGAEKNSRVRGACSPRSPYGFAINVGTLRRPPIVIDNVGRKRNAFAGNAEGENQVTCAGGRNDHLVCQSKEWRPNQPLYQLLPLAAPSGNKRGCVGTEEKG